MYIFNRCLPLRVTDEVGKFENIERRTNFSLFYHNYMWDVHIVRTLNDLSNPHNLSMTKMLIRCNPVLKTSTVKLLDHLFPRTHCLVDKDIH